MSQEQRRNQALENQKRRRAQRIDSARNLDLFAGLTLGPSDDEDEEDGSERRVVQLGMREYVPMLQEQPDDADLTRPSTASSTGVAMDAEGPTNFTKKKSRKKKKHGKGGPKPSKYADKCMYAELLEMRMEPAWGPDGQLDDSLPPDLETGWVAVAPVPVGKRCLAVTYQSSGVAGIVPNTQLRSRLLGKSLVRPFPSPLPAHTILDCILDENWRENGLLHVLDVVKWKGQDVGDCETAFRFWFRDSRLSEIPSMPPPLRARTAQPVPAESAAAEPTSYRFPYPCAFLPIPYDANTTLSHLADQIIPLARHARSVELTIPRPHKNVLPTGEVAGATTSQTEFRFALPTPATTPRPPGVDFVPAQTQVNIRADGLLLYVAQAGYEPGTSPLSNWVPIANYDSEEMGVEGGGRLDIFERLVKVRLARMERSTARHEIDMMEM